MDDDVVRNALPIKVVGVLLDDVMIVISFTCSVVSGFLFTVVSTAVYLKVDVEVKVVEVKVEPFVKVNVVLVAFISTESDFVGLVVCFEVEISVFIPNRRTNVHEIFSFFSIVQHS